MQEPLDRVAEEMMEAVGPKMLRHVGSQLETLQNVIALNPADQEVTDALGKDATLTEQQAYRQGHQSGWFKGALAFGCAALAGLAVLNVALSGGSKPGPKALLKDNS
jgi:hypothetical protein